MTLLELLALALVSAEDKDNEKKSNTKDPKAEETIEVLDRDITFGIRERICDENSCGLTDCPLYVQRQCIGNHSLKGIKVKIPARIIDAEAEDRKE